MGTVGLSFGSPTSGAGFDVSSTVASIVTNLQNVETPWKTQLTSLQSQDAVISTLGTLFSNLSTDMSALTDFQGVLAQKTGSSSDQGVLQLTAASSSAVAGTHTVIVNSLAQTASGYLAPVASATTTLSGSVTLRVGNGTAKTITLNSNDNTLTGLAKAINSSGIGISASVLTDASGSRLSLVSGSSGSAGNITISGNTLAAAAASTLSVKTTAGSSTANSTSVLSPVSGLSDALSGSISIQVGSGTAQVVNVPDSDKTLTGLMNAINGSSGIGVTASIVTNSDGTSSLLLASTTAGTAGTLTVSSSIADAATALSYTGTVAGSNASLTVDGVALSSASNTVANLIPGVTFQLLAPSATQSGGTFEQVQVVIGNNNTGVESTMAKMVSDYNSLISAINTQEGNTSSGTPEPLFGSPTLSLLQQQLLSGLNTQSPNGYLDPISANSSSTLSGTLSIQVGNGTTQNIVIGTAPGTPAANTTYTGPVNTLDDLAAAINAANIGVNANVMTKAGQSYLTFVSQTAGSGGDLSITSAIVSTAPTPLTFTHSATETATVPDSGVLTTIANANDTLSGSFTIKVGSGTAQTITLDSTNNTLTGLMNAINGLSGAGVTASLNTAGTALTLTSNTPGSAGTMSVNSNIADVTSPTGTTLNYTQSSNINNLTSLGLSVNNDGSLTFDAASLDSLLNTNFSAVTGFFQNANSWGQGFSTMLNRAGSSSSTGILSLASTSNSNIESTLNREISKEESFISAQRISLMTALNTANQIMTQLPSQLQGVNELYSAISGYNQNKG